MDSAREHTCVYCGESFKTDELCWYIQRELFKDVVRHYEYADASNEEGEVGGYSLVYKPHEYADASSEEDEVDGRGIVYQSQNSDGKPFWDAMDAFEVDDEKGKNFYRLMGGTLTHDMCKKRPAIVNPKTFDNSVSLNFSPESEDTSAETSASPNIYRSPKGTLVCVFRTLPEGDENYPGIRFTDEFVNLMEKLGVTTLIPNRSYIEENCIRPLCPRCSSFLPPELIYDPEHNDVVKLAFIGPVSSGKTSFSMVNVILDRFARGKWSTSSAGTLAATHYLLDKTYYAERLQERSFGNRTPHKAYLPPLLLRLRHSNSRNVLLVLMDIAGESLQEYRNHLNETRLERRDYYYQHLLKDVDGYLLMLDGEQEVQGFASLRRAPENQKDTVTLKQLLELYGSISSVSSAQRSLKPAALVITKCDTLFHGDRTLDKTSFDKLFTPLTPLEKALWQMDETPEAANGAWQANRHEALQLGLKECLRTWSPGLWNILRKNFSRVDIFPESSVGHASVETADLNEKDIRTLGLEPFYTADPVFWLLDMVERRRAANEWPK